MVTAVSYMCDQHLRTEINIAKSTVDRRSFATVGYLTRCCISTSATWFERIISARTFYMASLPEKDAEEDHGDAGLTTSSNGLEYPPQSVFSSTQRTEARGEPWCPCQWPPTLSHEDGPRQGKAASSAKHAAPVINPMCIHLFIAIEDAIITDELH